MNQSTPSTTAGSAGISVVLQVRIALVLLVASCVAAFWFSRSPVISPEERFLIGLQSLEERNLPLVEQQIQTLRNEPEFQRHLALLEGGRLVSRQQYAAALERLAQTRPEGLLREPALDFTAQALYGLGRLREAEQLLNDLLDENPQHVRATRLLAALAYDLGAMDGALRMLERLAELAPDDFSPHRLTGQIHLDFERYPQAIEAYQAALQRPIPEPIQREVRVQLAKALVRHRDYAAALATLRDFNDDPTSLALQAESAWGLGDQNQTERFLTEARMLDPEDRDVLWLTARLAFDRQQWAAAFEALTALLKLFPHDYEARYQLVLTLLRLGQEEQAQAERQRMDQDRQRFEKLTELSRQANENPFDPAVRRELAALCRELSKHDLAATWESAAAACLPPNTD